VASARSAEERKRDTLHRLEHDVDAWVATADGSGGTPYLAPLSFLWDGGVIWLATPAASATSRNLQATGKVRLGIGDTRDLVLIHGTAEALMPSELTQELGDAFAVKTGFDPRKLSDPYLYFRIAPRRVMAWREENELAGRELMRAGEWLA
jgi:general stress protein 26